MSVKFDLAKYDVGGNGGIKGDGKLNGEEVEKAEADGWNVWEGYSKKNGAPKQISKRKQEAEKTMFMVKDYDLGGDNAIAGDGKITGDELTRAHRAGYRDIAEGDTQSTIDRSGYKHRCNTDATAWLARWTAKQTDNSFLYYAATTLSVGLAPLTMVIDAGITLYRAYTE